MKHARLERRRVRMAGPALLVILVTSAGLAQSDRWYPSRWGADDQRGAANRLTPAKVLEAKGAITRGMVYQLGRVYEAGMPMFGTRHYSLRIPKPFNLGGKNEGVYHDDIISGELGQIGTQFDSLGHFGIGDLFYNGNRGSQFAQPEGLARLGVENVGAIFTRGVLIDVARFKGVERLGAMYEITVDDLRGAMQRQKTVIRAGDVVLIHTGWGSLWMKDNATFTGSSPGIGLAAAQLLVDAEVVMVGADNWGVEVFPKPDASLNAPVHQLLLTRNGIYLHENLATEVLARDDVYEFAYSFAPLRLKGATGSQATRSRIR